MKSEYKEEVIRDFTLTLTVGEVGQLIYILQDWSDWGKEELPNRIPEVLKEMLIELNRMSAESEAGK